MNAGAVQAVFKSGHPDVIEAQRAFEVRAQQFRDYVDTLKEKYGRDPLVSRNSSTAVVVVGLQPLEGENRKSEFPPPLRWGVREGFLVPDRRKKAGTALASEFARYNVGRPKYPGMSGIAIGGGLGGMAMFSPGSEKVGDEIWVIWGCGPESVGADAEIWTQVPLSQYYAMKEAQQ